MPAFMNEERFKFNPSLGDAPPKVVGIRYYDVGKVSRLRIDADIRWVSNMQIGLWLDLQGGSQDKLPSYQS